MRAVLGLLGIGLLQLSQTSCLGTPTPLAPGLAGSVGWPYHGVQTGAVELPASGPGFVRYRKVGGFYWGQPSLVQAVQAAAQRVQEALPGGGPLVIGDLSARGGGRVTRHASHRSGRDVDLLWYMTTPDGAAIGNTHFVQVGADGLGREPDSDAYVRLDVAREWLLIKSLLGSKEIDVQWLFASRAVEALLVDYALARDEDPELIWHAENVLQEPAESLPHDDHLHLRIACSPEASVQGCEAGGPYWSWLPALPAAFQPAHLQAADELETAAFASTAGASAVSASAVADPAPDPAISDPAASDTADLEELL
jgi:penicillin-insensitive murein endopeptidase